MVEAVEQAWIGWCRRLEASLKARKKKKKSLMILAAQRVKHARLGGKAPTIIEDRWCDVGTLEAT